MPRSGGFSRTRLRRMGDAMRRRVERGEVAGVVALLCRRDEVHVEAIGASELGGGQPIGRDALFRVASMTKPIAAVAAMILVEEARLRLDEPVDRLLPELRDRKVLRGVDRPLDDTVPAERPMTLRDLLTFRAGFGLIWDAPPRCPIRDALDEAGLAPGPIPLALDPDELMRRLGGLPLAHQPGERWLYHTAYDALGVLIARAAGTSIEDFLAERIFAPLGMRDTGFAVPPAELGRLATPYARDGATGSLVVYDAASPAAVLPSGSTGLFSTVDDYLAFGRMMLNGGRHGRERVLARPTVELMTTDQLTPEQKALSPFGPGFWDSRGWGLGVSVVTRRDDVAAVPGRFGWEGGLGTAWGSDPREDVVAILMVQRLWDQVVADIHADFWTLAYQSIDD